MKKILRLLLRCILLFFPIERGKYTILTKYYLPKLAPTEDKIVVAKARGGFKMYLDLTEFIQSFVYFFRAYELPTIKFVEKALKSSDTAIDVGANVGYLTLTFANIVGDKGKVYSFEPEKKNYDIMLKNIELNNFTNVSSQKLALAEENKNIKLFLSKNENAGTHSTFFHSDTLSEEYEEVKAIRLDDFVQENKISKINLIKIDVEGAEIDVINGMPKILKGYKPLIILELVSSIQNLRSFTTSDFKKMMYDKYSYIPFHINDNGSIQEINLETEHISDNVVFINKDKIDNYNEIIKNF